MLWSKVWWERRCPDGAGGCPSERAGIRQQWSVQSVRWEVSAEKNFRAGTGVVLNSWWRGEGRSGSPAVSAKYVAFIENTMPKLRYERKHHVFPQFPRFFYASGFCRGYFLSVSLRQCVCTRFLLQSDMYLGTRKMMQRLPHYWELFTRGTTVHTAKLGLGRCHLLISWCVIAFVLWCCAFSFFFAF